ncbi:MULTISPECIES: hypothetical protein [Tenacibaculum]|uniref:hypothetical protein n=1 Tax=Tenacibaculum TaxID=104267 RepID=UPI0015881E24|nr:MULTISPECIES: hypothetical protein [Tenacibaculum]MCF2874059.1 hypothetical protein [Tenacibaculum sp. Cn5-1]MCF2934640.1 hypothetical protein [Tenacibaculum sp. Cn5-34]MCG7510850.1 hypothetical protein [Tenacibaculum sp. Cn5-46]
MLKNISSLGSELSKSEQKSIKGGFGDSGCPWGKCRNKFGRCSMIECQRQQEL